MDDAQKGARAVRQDRGPRGRALLPRLHPRFAGAHCRGICTLQAGPRAAPGLPRREARRPGPRAHHRRAPEIRRRRPVAHAGLAASRGASAGSGRAAEPSRGGDPSHDPARGTALKMRGTGFHARRRPPHAPTARAACLQEGPGGTARCRTRKQFTTGKRAPSAARPGVARPLSHRAPTCPAKQPRSAQGSEQLQDVKRVVEALAPAARGRRRGQAQR
jgi:hypothetical protein